jgi:endonuclease YncB( thermonuclease family)
MAKGIADIKTGGRGIAATMSALAVTASAAAAPALIAAAALVGIPLPARAADSGCRLDTLGTGAVGAVVDAASFRLADGREVRLAALEVPLPRRDAGGKAAGGVSAAQAAQAALSRLLAGGQVTLKRPRGASEETDRYGRLVAYAVVNRDGVDIPVQAAMLAGGHARVAASVGEPDCAAVLIAAEARARKAKIGLWADPDYRVRRADDPAAILADRGRFAVVEGKVLSVRASGARIYVNFGRVWTRDFTVTIARRDERLFAAAGLSPATLAGRRVRVRGWVEARGGPQIAASRPGQIEIAEAQ